MARKKGELKSGSIRRQVFIGYEPILDDDGKTVLDSNGKIKKKRIYESITCSSKTEADLLANQIRIDRSAYMGPKCNMTYGQALDAYIESKSKILAPSTIREYKRSRRCDLQDIIDTPIKDITQEMIDNTINKESEHLAPKTVSNIHGLFYAVMSKYRPSFCINTTLPQKVKYDRYIPTDSDIEKLLDTVNNEDMTIAILLAAFGPLRRSEICGVESTDIKGNVLHVQRAIVEDENKQWVTKTTKTGAGNRFIPLPDIVCNKLKGRIGKLVNLNPNQITSRFEHIRRRAGLPHFRFHDLKHYCASILHAINIPDAYIMERGGWSSDDVLKDVYRHTLNDQQKIMNTKANEHFIGVMNKKEEKPDISHDDIEILKEYLAWLTSESLEDTEENFHKFMNVSCCKSCCK